MSASSIRPPCTSPGSSTPAPSCIPTPSGGTRSRAGRSWTPPSTARSRKPWSAAIQAGSSGRGRRFGARRAEVIFTIQTSGKAMRAFRSDVHALMAEHGRAPETCKVLPSIMPFIGDTGSEAREKRLAPSGMKVEWHQFAAGPQLFEALNAGSLDFGHAAGLPFVLVAAEPPYSKARPCSGPRVPR